MNAPRLRISLCAMAALALVPGCLEWKKQTLLLKFDEKTDAIAILAVYEGFHVGGSSDKAALKDAKDELAKFVGDEPVLHLLSGFGGADLNPGPSDKPEDAAMKRRLAKIVDLGRGKLLLNEEGKLSAWQTITIRDRKAFEEVLNEGISEGLAKDQPASQPDPFLSVQSIRLIKEAATAKHRWLTIKPCRIVLDIPMTAEDAAKFLDKLQTDRETREALAGMRKTFGAVEVVKTDRGLSATLGDGKGRLMTICAVAGDSKLRMEAELIEFAKTPPMSIDRSIETKALMERFRSGP